MLTRPVPRTNEPLPVVGLGTWRTFDEDVAPGRAARDRLLDVLKRFHDGGGRVVDSSPMYGRAEAAVGELSTAAGLDADLFLASKVWTSGARAGAEQARTTLRLMRRQRLDLLQVHNLVDWRTQLDLLRRMKDAGAVRYVGVTHYRTSSFGELAEILRTEHVDFVQLPYSIATREAGRRLLPAARETGTAVLVNRPFEEGELFRAVRGRALPPWAAELGVRGWGGFFLKYILAEPAVTCVLAATGDPKHLDENLDGGRGALPDAKQRAEMVRAFERQ